MAITSRALAFASRWFDEATVRRTFEPLIADWQREWQDAPSSRRWRVSMRGLAAFICALIVSSPAVLVTRAPKSVTDRVAIRMTRFIALGSLLLMLPFVSQVQDETGSRAAMLVLALLPSSIAAVFPFSVIGAADAIRRTQPIAQHVERALVLKLAAVTVIFMIVLIGFVVPAANQAFRVIETEGGNPLVRGVRELTTWQLVNDPAMASGHEPHTGAADRAIRIKRELNNRAASALMPVFFLWLRWMAIETGRGTRWSPLPAPLVTASMIAVFVATSFWSSLLEQQLDWPPGSRHWGPIAAFATWGMLSIYWRRAPRHSGT